MSSFAQYLKDSKWGPFTVIVVFAICAFIAGAVVAVIIGGETLTRFLQIAHQAWGFLVAAGLVGVGRGIHLASTSNDPSYKGDPTDDQGADDHSVDDNSASVRVSAPVPAPVRGTEVG